MRLCVSGFVRSCVREAGASAGISREVLDKLDKGTYASANNCIALTLIQRGRGTGPMKPQQPPVARRGGAKSGSADWKMSGGATRPAVGVCGHPHQDLMGAFCLCAKPEARAGAPRVETLGWRLAAARRKARLRGLASIDFCNSESIRCAAPCPATIAPGRCRRVPLRAREGWGCDCVSAGGAATNVRSVWQGGVGCMCCWPLA